ncbi:MAG: membrane protein insertion efficiency factor YidD [Nitrosomonas sp.]|nr:membrane protein insertion efficiency factor YidD [Nitrosomonas sp.]MBP6076056.1 membrane protein insertion efficiency factor YidD [Nitrosomonas sp.]
MSRLIIAFIKFYQYCISPFLAPSCRFSPTCSQYACEAYAKYGLFHGTRLSIWRILRCNPWSKGGYEPVP